MFSKGAVLVAALFVLLIKNKINKQTGKQMTIRNAFIRVSEFVNQMPAVVEQIGAELSPEIVKMNQDQLAAGITAESDQIGDKAPFYHPGYFDGHKQHRQLLGLQVDHVDLKMTGKFYESLFVELDGVKYSIMSNDDPAKVEALMYGGKSGGQSLCGCQSVRKGGFGEDILGLTYDNAKYIQEKGTNQFKEKFKEITGFS